MDTKIAKPSKTSRRTHKRKALRAAFVVTTALSAAGCSDVITNPPPTDCPAARPSSGASCDEQMQCVYDDDCNLEVIATCGEDGSWSLQYDGTCNPPPPPECPVDAPTQGDPCDLEIGTCSYTGECDETFSATCDVDGWSVEPSVSCNPPPPCPTELPIEGEECELTPGGPPEGCSYEVVTACGPQAVAAECVVSKEGPVLWQLEAPPCTPKVPDCSLYDNSGPCDADSTCRWLVPGCGEGEADFVPFCAPIDDCTVDSCGPSEACVTVNYNPCWNSKCGACGADAMVCAELQE